MKKLTLFLLTTAPHIALSQGSLTTAQIAEKASASVVVIQGKTESGDALGSGFIVSGDGKIATNLHVIRDLKAASIQLSNGKTFDSLLVLAIDERRDLAIVKVAGFNLPALDLGNSDALSVAEPVMVVGSPRGLAGTVTAGILSAIREGDDFKILQTDAAVNPGNSGGPLVNSVAQAVGVVSFKLRSAEGLNFAIPINYVRSLLSNLHEPMTLNQMRSSMTIVPEQLTNGPSLTETLNWLKLKIPLGIVRHAYFLQGRKKGYGATVWYTTQARGLALDSCAATVGFDSTTEVEGAQQSVTNTVRYTVPLGLISGGVTEKKPTETFNPFVSGDQWEYVLNLTASSKGILAEDYYAGSGRSSTRTTDLVQLIFPEESLAQRVLEAFRHAGDLCRNKEPF
jgi:hypothetical protein